MLHRPAARVSAKARPGFALHLGFHKTASTSLQAVLEGARRDLLAADCKVIPHQKIRNRFTRPVQMHTNQSLGMSYGEPLSEEALRAFVATTLRPNIFQKFQRVVMSEENAAGHIGQCAFTGNLYRFPKAYLAAFAQFLPVAPTEVHVVIRNYASFFASCYIEWLGAASADRFLTPDIMVAKVMSNVPSWPALLGALARVFPTAQIHVWQFEGLRTQMGDLVTSLTGLDGDAPLAKSVPVLRKGAGQAAFDAFDAVRRRDGVTTALATWATLKHTGGDAPFDPWTDAQRAHLDALYQADLTALAGDARFHLQGGRG